MVKFSVLIVFQGIGLENVRNDQMKQIFKKNNVPKGMYAPRLSHIHDDKIALSNNISSEATGPIKAIFHILHLGKGRIKVCAFLCKSVIQDGRHAHIW